MSFLGGTKPADIVYARFNEKGQMIYGLKGGKTQTPRFFKDSSIAAQWADLISSHGFIKLPGLAVALNPQNLATVLFTRDHYVKGHDDTGAMHVFATASDERVLPILDEIYARTGMMKLGNFHMLVNNGRVGDAAYNETSGEFALYLHGARNAFFSQAMSAPAAEKVQKSLKDQGFYAPPGTVRKPVAGSAPGGKKNATPADTALADKLQTLPDDLKARVVGQDRAADELAVALRLSAAGLQDDNKPIGSFLFLGPTGVGKTEEARELARVLGVPFLKIDMSEYKEKHNVARMIGAPPGYVNGSDGGALTNFVKKNEYCVVMLDEIEKAHRDVFDILLQVMDDARLTDGRNVTVDFKKVILIMTSNLGTSQQKSGPLGFGKHAAATEDDYDPRLDPAVTACFSLEFINRLDAVVRFRALNREDMLKITDIFVGVLEKKLAARDTKITLTPAAKEYLAAKGHDPLFGARPLKRLMRDELNKPLSDEILFGKLKHGGTVAVDVAPDTKRLTLTFSSAAAPETPAIAAKQTPPVPAPPPRRPGIG